MTNTSRLLSKEERDAVRNHGVPCGPFILGQLSDTADHWEREAEKLQQALAATEELMPLAGIVSECDLGDDALIYQGSATSEDWRCHVPMGVAAIWSRLPEPIRMLVFLCCFPVSQHRCGGYAEVERLRGVLVNLKDEFKASDEERLQETQSAHSEAIRWKTEGDMYGWNFHEGRAAGITWASIYFYRVFRKLEAILAKEGP